MKKNTKIKKKNLNVINQILEEFYRLYNDSNNIKLILKLFISK